jgi:N-methylhydantoinase A
MRFATDSAGTFTNLVIEEKGKLSRIKLPTRPSNSVDGALAAFSIAAEGFDMGCWQSFASGKLFIHDTTYAISANVTKRVARTAALVAKGHSDIWCHVGGWQPNRGGE